MKKVEELFADYLEGKVKEPEMEIFLSENPFYRQEFEELKQLFHELPVEGEISVSAAADSSFYSFLEKKSKPRFSLEWGFMKYAAGLAIIVGAYFLGSRKPDPEVVTIEKPVYITQKVVDTVFAVPASKPNEKQHGRTSKDLNVKQEIEEIKKGINQINEVQSRMIIAMLRQESASARLEAINNTYDMDLAGPQLLNALASTLEADPSINVRLAALDAMGRFELPKDIRESMVYTLAEERDASLQLALVNKLIKMREQKALPVFEALAGNPNTREQIRNQAEFGIKMLQL